MATYDKRHSISMIASAAVAGARLVSKAGAHATTSADVVAISEGAAVLGRSFSAITFFSGLVEAAEVIPDGSPVKPAGDGTGRAAVGTDGDNCGWAVYGASKMGAMASVHVVEGRGRVSGGGNDPVKTLDPVDSFNFQACSSFEQYLFGFDTAFGQVKTLDRNTGEIASYGVPIPGNTLISNVKCLAPGRVLCATLAGTQYNKYYLTKDYGASWALVHTMDIENTSLSLNPKGMCVAELGGRKVIITGEYNVNSARVNGAANDRVALLRSDDMGETWSEITRWNTDGAKNNIRHIHGVSQNPSNGRIYVCTGDNDSQSAIYSWDGVSAWPINVTPANVLQTEGLRCAANRQSLRVIDPTFKDGWIYIGSDSETGGSVGAMESGIWKIKDDLDIATLTKISSPMTNCRNMAAWFQDVLPTGELVIFTGNALTTLDGQKLNQVIVSNKGWTEFKSVAAYRGIDTATYMVPLHMSVYNGKIWMSCINSSGKQAYSTAVCELSKNDFRGDTYEGTYRYDTIHPVFWIDEVAGNDANDGYRPSQAFKTLNYALTGGRLTYGARLQIIGSFTKVDVNVPPIFHGHPRAGDESEPVVIAGGGVSKTTFSHGLAAATSVCFTMSGATPQRLEMQDMSIKIIKDGATFVNSDASIGAGHAFGFVRCLVGDYKQTATKPTRIAQSDRTLIYGYDSVFESALSITNPSIESAVGGGGKFYFEHCAFVGGNTQFRFRGAMASEFNFRYCVSVGAVIAAIQIDAGAVVTTRTAFKCNYHSDYVNGLKLINDLAGLLWNGEFKMCETSGSDRGVGTAFDGYSINKVQTVPLIDYLDYVH